MKYQEFEHLKKLEDKENPLSDLYEDEEGNTFYIEPIFYSYFTNFKTFYPEKANDVLDELFRVVKVNKKVIFTGMDEEYEDEPVTKKEGYIIYTFFDLTDKLKIFLENKSRGSDYGD